LLARLQRSVATARDPLEGMPHATPNQRPSAILLQLNALLTNARADIAAHHQRIADALGLRLPAIWALEISRAALGERWLAGCQQEQTDEEPEQP
jgi:hypothetical protein